MLFQLDQLHATISEPLGEDVALKGMIRNPPPSSTPARYPPSLSPARYPPFLSPRLLSNLPSQDSGKRLRSSARRSS